MDIAEGITLGQKRNYWKGLKMKKNSNPPIEHNCIKCDLKFIAYKSNKRKYCSYKCAYESRLKENNQNWRGGTTFKFCFKCGKGYRTVDPRSKYCSRDCCTNSKEWIENVFKANWKRPTSLEKRFIKIIEKYNLPYRYTGNGSFLIGYKNPDFVNTNGDKICIEVANHFHHQGNWAEKRIEHFAKWGWKCLIFWSKRNKSEFEFSEEEIVPKCQL